MRAVALASLMAFAVACGDPTHDRAVESLGPEKGGVPPGPLHRPGQPCLTCHGEEGPAALGMAFGGTVFAYLDGAAPGAGAAVRVLDARNRTFDVVANCVGNFWIPNRDFVPTFPVTAALTIGGFSRVMTTEMHRDGSCNACHASPANPRSPGHLWALPPGSDPPMVECTRDESPRGTASVLVDCGADAAAPVCPDTPPTYAKDVAPILQANCTGCHQSRGQNPNPSLTSYKLVNAPKTKGTMNSLVSQCRMPPPPLPPLSAPDRATISCWIQGGSKQ